MTLFVFLSGCLLFAVFFLITKRWQHSTVEHDNNSAEWLALVSKRDEIEQDIHLSEAGKETLRQDWAMTAEAILSKYEDAKQNHTQSFSHNAHHIKKLVIASLLLALIAYFFVGQWHAEGLQWPTIQRIAQTGLQTSAEPPPAEGAKHPGDMKSLDERIAQLRQKLKENPDDLERWVLLARSLSVQRDFNGAALAIREALRLTPGHPDLLVDLADVVAMTHNSSLQGEPDKLIEQALLSAPNHPKALALAATSAMQQGNQTLALSYWQRLRATYPETSADVARIDEIVKQIQTQGLVRPTPPNPTSTQDANATTAVLSGEVTISPALMNTLKTQDTSQAMLYVFAKMESGPPMPLAVFKSPITALVKGGSVAFNLDDSMAMRPDLTLSSTKQVRLEARIAMTGNAIKQAGDYAVVLNSVKVGSTGLQLKIAEQVK